MSVARWSAVGLVACLLAAGGIDAPVGFVAAAAPVGAKLVPHEPLRVLDSRTGVGMPAHKLAAGETVTLQFDTASGVSADATAVALNLTVTESDAAGFISAWPAGTQRPVVSNLNVTGVGQTVANFAIVPLGADRSVSFFTYAGAHLVVDYSGFWVPADSSTDGRYLAVSPVRVFDTRNVLTPPADGATVQVQIAGAGDVPSSASAVVVGVTAVGATGPGFVTVWPAGSGRPLASTLNVAGPNAVANLALVPLGANGRISVFVQRSAHVIVDVQGYVTGASAAASTAGLFVAIPPVRVADSRQDLRLARMGALFDQELVIDAGSGIPSTGVSAVAANFTATLPRAPGYLTVYPGRTPRPLASTLNFAANDTVAAFGLPRLGAQNSLELVTMKQTDVIVDVSGYFLGEPVAAVTPPPIKCSDLMIYDHAPEGIENAVDYELRVRDLSGNNPDRSLVDPSIFFRIAPGCQYVIVARESLAFPGSLAHNRNDSLQQPTNPTLIADDLPWRGAAITDNAEWIYLYAGWIEVDAVRQEAIIAVNAWTGEERLVAAPRQMYYVVGVSAANEPLILQFKPASPPKVSICRFGAQSDWFDPCSASVGAGDEFTGFGGYGAAIYFELAFWTVQTGVGTAVGANVAAAANPYHPRLLWQGSPAFGVPGRGYVVWRVTPDVPNGSLYVVDFFEPGELVLDGVYDDFPEFSRPLSRKSYSPPDITSECAFEPPWCAAS